MENANVFNNWKHQLEDVILQNPIDCLRIVELNVSNVCNLKCPFCPQSSKYVSDQGFCSISLVEEIKNQLKSINFNGYICIAGHGEPTLHPKIIEIIEKLSEFKVVLVTNGIPLSSASIKHISALCQIKVSVHNWNNKQWYFDKFAETNAIFRNHDMENPQMNLYNRAGAISSDFKPLMTICNYPFYKMMIDVDGTYRICEADWLNKTKSNYTVFEVPIDQHFIFKAKQYREKMLMPYHRQNIECCKMCNINGCLAGNKFKEFLARK